MKHGFDKVATKFREDPAAAKDKMLFMNLSNSLFSRELTGAVKTQGAGGVAFPPGPFFTAIKNIVCGKVYQRDVVATAGFGEVGGAGFINQIGAILLRFCQIDLCV